jgi:branched-chain amino acid aminotransferase
MALQIFISGKYYDKDDARISVYDHGLLYGDGVFEGIRSYHGKVFRLAQHVQRLYDSAKAIHLEIPMSQQAMADAVVETCRINGLKDAYIRLVVTRGAGSLGLDIRRTSNPQVIIIADSIQLYPKELYDRGLDVVTAGTILNHPQALNPRVKSLNYLNNIMARLEGTLAGCEEVLMLNHKGEVAECSGDNVFVVKNQEISTPPLDAGILDGITRGAVIELARTAGYTLHERSMTRHDLYIADEMFLTGTAAELIPVIKLDGRSIGTGKPGPVFKNLLERFRRLVMEE